MGLEDSAHPTKTAGVTGYSPELRKKRLRALRIVLVLLAAATALGER